MNNWKKIMIQESKWRLFLGDVGKIEDHHFGIKNKVTGLRGYPDPRCPSRVLNKE